MTVNTNKDTFLSLGELFSGWAVRCLEAERALRKYTGDADAPYSQAMELVADAEERLGTELAKYAETGPENVVSTRVQYKLQHDSLPAPTTLSVALKNVTELNSEFASILQDLSDKSAPETLQQVIETLRQDVEHVNKQVSMIRLTVQDI